MTYRLSGLAELDLADIWSYPPRTPASRLLIGCLTTSSTDSSCWPNSRYPTTFPRARLLPNHDLDVLVERGQEIHQTFHGKAR